MDLEKLEGIELVIFERKHEFPGMQKLDVFYLKDHNASVN